MKNENIYRVTLVDGPTTAIIPIKARDASHATRIASRMGLGRVARVDFACEDNFEKV
jgi:hypothetical protein